MAKDSKIEWTDATWNSWYGCHKVSQGCKNCYMYRDMPRFGKDPNTVVRSKTTFYDPLKWKDPRRIFTCSWSDFFIEEADPWRDEAFAIMALTPQHTYQVLTKRPDRMLEYFKNRDELGDRIGDIAAQFDDRFSEDGGWNFNFEEMPEHIWLGVSVEDQKTADERIPLLLQTPAAIRWLSIEPLLGPVNLREFIGHSNYPGNVPGHCVDINGETWHDRDYKCRDCGWGYPNDPDWLRRVTGIDWIVAGGESGPYARPMHPDWVRSIRDQCNAASVPFFFKQWGEWWPMSQTPDFWIDQHPRYAKRSMVLQLDGSDQGLYFPSGAMTCFKVGKSVSGRVLDGRTWDEMPEVSR